MYMIYLGVSIALILLLVTSLVSTNVLGQADSNLAPTIQPSTVPEDLQTILTGVIVDCAIIIQGTGPGGESCEKGMAWLSIECETYYNVSEMCRENRPAINKYLTDKGLDSIDIKYFHDYFQTKIVDSGLSYEEIITQQIS